MIWEAKRQPPTTEGMTNLLEKHVKPGNADTYDRRLKRAVVPLVALQHLLSMDGDYALRMEGWPKNAKIVGAQVVTYPKYAVVFYLYHPDFLVIPHGTEPPDITIKARRRG